MSLRRLAAITLICAGLAALGEAGWIRGKAVLAQVLLEDAWLEARAGETRPRPWPWADTWPIARIVSPRLGVDRIVLAGASMRNLAFGPGHFDGTPLPGKPGNSVVAGHRDTHFRFLRHLGVGDQLLVETVDGGEALYRVTEVAVVEADDRSILAPTADGVITLVTCYPFDGVERPERRYAVRAVRRDRIG